MGRTAAYFAFGDSLTAGVGTTPGGGFAYQYHHKLEESLGKGIKFMISGTTGALSGELLQKLRTQAWIKSAVQEAQLITITAGGNDLIQAAVPFFMQGQSDHLISALRKFVVNARQIVSTIHSIKASCEPYLILIIGLYNPVSAVPISGIWVRKFNRYMQALQRGKTVYVDVYHAFQNKEDYLLSDDFIHPNALGYHVMTREVFRAVPETHLRRIFN